MGASKPTINLRKERERNISNIDWLLDEEKPLKSHSKEHQDVVASFHRKIFSPLKLYECDDIFLREMKIKSIHFIIR